MGSAKFLGVYVRKGKAGRPGKGPMFFVWRLGEGYYAIQELDQAFTPKGAVLGIEAARFEAAFRLEPSLLAAPMTAPDFRHLSVPKAATELTDSALADLEKARQAKQVETDLRSSFSKAMRSLARPRERGAAIAAIERIAYARKGIVPEHKHMFRDFGVALRKKSLNDLAIACAARAVELAPDDDHAHFNLARLLGIKGRFVEADEELGIAMKLDPTEKVYDRLSRYLARDHRRAIGADGEFSSRKRDE